MEGIRELRDDLESFLTSVRESVNSYPSWHVSKIAATAPVWTHHKLVLSADRKVWNELQGLSGSFTERNFTAWLSTYF